MTSNLNMTYGQHSVWHESDLNSLNATCRLDSIASLTDEAIYSNNGFAAFPPIDDFAFDRDSEHSFDNQQPVPMFMDARNMYLDLDTSTVNHVGAYLGLMSEFPNELDSFLRPAAYGLAPKPSPAPQPQLVVSDDGQNLASISRGPSPERQELSPLPQSRRASTLSKSVTDSGRSVSVSSSTHDSDSSTAKGLRSLTTKWKPEFQPRSCPYNGCNCKVVFTRTCDFRKHYNRHFKHLFCRIQGCPQSEAGSAAPSRDDNTDTIEKQGCFSNKKDRARHEARHNPTIRCEWTDPEGIRCQRVFSRIDNMKDHMKRVHRQRKFLKPLEMELRPRPPLHDANEQDCDE